MKALKSGILLVAVITFVIANIDILQAQDKQVVRYLAPDQTIGYGTDYFTELLRLSLEKTVESHGPYELVPAEMAMQQVDALRAVRTGHLDVMHTMTDRVRERVFVPVRVPLVKGLIGARLFMVNEAEQRRWAYARSVQDFGNATLGQGADWPDTEILRRAGFTIKGSTTYNELFTMLESGEINAFPRGAFEIWDEIEQHADQNFVVADGFYLYYPTMIYFFTRLDEGGHDLARRIEAGLKTAIEDGSFDELFMQFMGEHVKKADLDNRTVIRINNPTLPDNAPLNNPAFWYIAH